MFCRWPFYARAHICFMYCSNLDILFAYPSHLGPWATFGGLVRLVVVRVQDIFPGYWSFCVSWEVIINFMQYLKNVTKHNFRGPFGDFWWALAAMKISRECSIKRTTVYRHDCHDDCYFATFLDLFYALWALGPHLVPFWRALCSKYFFLALAILCCWGC